jgi:hypothetical protein
MGCLIGYSNKLDSATLTGGSWTTSLPLNFLKTRLLGQVARTANTLQASSTFNIDFGVPRDIRVASLVNHNISIFGKVIISASEDNFATTAYTSGEIEAWPAVYSFGTLEWEDDAWWSGTYTAEDAEGYTTNVTHIIPQLAYYRYWRIQIIDETNADGYIQLGRVFLGSAWQPTRDAEVGLALGWESATTVQKALSGTKYFQRRNPYRVTRFTLNVINIDEALNMAFEIDKRMGIDGEILWIQDVNDTVHALRRRYLGTMRELSLIEFPYVGLGKKSYSIEEIV